LWFGHERGNSVVKCVVIYKGIIKFINNEKSVNHHTDQKWAPIY